MKKQILFIVLFLIINNLVFAQTIFQKRFGGTSWERGQMTERTNDGGIIIAGYTSSYDVGSGDFILIKLDNNFDYSWSSVFGGAGIDWAFSVCENLDDGVEFETLSIVEGAGTSNITLYYEFTDEYPLPGISYYKLMQTDYDGTASFSDIISIERDENNLVSIYPNPATNYIDLRCNFNKNAKATIKIFNSFGQIVSTEIVKENTTNIDISSFVSGVYFVKVVTDTNEYIEKLIVN